MKSRHTSDWHIGRTLYSKKRYEEFEAFPLEKLDGIRNPGDSRKLL